jgi:hypothetical protein
LAIAGSPVLSLEVVVVEYPPARNQHLHLGPAGDETLALLEHVDHVLMG